MSATPYRRTLSPMERYCLVINRVYRYHVDAVVEGVGALDPSVLQAAVATAAAANPGVRVRLRGALGWARWVDSGRAPAVHVIADSSWDGGSERGAEFMAQRLDPAGGGPVADVMQVHGWDGRTRLVFRGLHAAFDGRGMMHWTADVFRALRGEPPLGSTATLSDLDVQDQYRDRVQSAAIPAPSACVPVLDHGGPAAPLAYLWRRVSIPGRAPNLLARSAMFLAAWARRTAGTAGGSGGIAAENATENAAEVAFTIPVDYRGLRTDAVGIGNLTGYVRLSVAPDDSPRTLMRQLKQRLDAHADCRRAPNARRLLWTPLAYLTRQLRKQRDYLLYSVNPHLPSGGIVAMGAVSSEQYSCAGFLAKAIYGIPGAVGKLNLVLVGNPDFVVATFAAPAAYNHNGQLDALVQAYRAHFSGGAEVTATE